MDEKLEGQKNEATEETSSPNGEQKAGIGLNLPFSPDGGGNGDQSAGVQRKEHTFSRRRTVSLSDEGEGTPDEDKSAKTAPPEPTPAPPRDYSSWRRENADIASSPELESTPPKSYSPRRRETADTSSSRRSDSNESPRTAAEISEDKGFEAPVITEQAGVQLGILGSKGTGKTFLFEAMVHRTVSGGNAGALSTFFKGGGNKLYKSTIQKSTGAPLAWSRADTQAVLGAFRNWIRQDQTMEEFETWYQLKINYYAGFRRLQRHLSVSFLDASGEALLRGPGVERRQLWQAAYLKPEIIIICIPFWVVFPNYDSPALDEKQRDRILSDSFTVFQHYDELLEAAGRRRQVTPILALTMADDARCGLPEVRQHWVHAFTQTEETYAHRFKNQGVVARYLSQARGVSEHLSEELSAGNADIDWILPSLNLIGKTKPWIIPMTACDGAYLQRRIREAEHATSSEDSPMESIPRGPKKHPVPAHVELPLLLALCDDTNALM